MGFGAVSQEFLSSLCQRREGESVAWDVSVSAAFSIRGAQRAAHALALCPHAGASQLLVSSSPSPEPGSPLTGLDHGLYSFQENGWGAYLAERLVRKCDVVNRGISGYNTRWAKLILPRLITESTSADSIVAVTIFFGANDSALKELNPKQHVPLEEYAANLKSMVQYLKSVDISADRIILITPPPLQESAWEKACLAKGDKLTRCNATTGQYAQACVQVARECGTDVLDLWTLMQKNQDFSSYLSDGLHLSTKGNSFLAAQLWSRLENKLSALPSLLPYWRDVDHTNPEASLL
ncbi:PREDICTED: isoamyl acetate-hydrolyzing esterase 1 homolog [Corvus brachyrhynchos]|uniref:isoamyl acetate-hydrolyzing esterase 1 homolog n=1 Tax=Corvus brachyrhynchos TaxID=85066 RepID=UPI0004DE0B10|nr:PREDICTED: isoamyl acetate-hydrolyzing esterase 1 homolog [Corvus brachyrhynchos]